MNRAKAPCQERFIDGFTEVADNAIIQCAVTVSVIGEGSDEDCRYRAPGGAEVSAKVKAIHFGHLNVADQAGRLEEMRRCEKIGRRRERLHGVAQRSHEPSHGLAKVPIVFDHRNQGRSRHAASGCPRLARTMRTGPATPQRLVP